jgi:hypothetical protein
MNPPRFPWFRLYSEITHDEKVVLLDPADRWFYVALMCCKCSGLLDGNNGLVLRRKVAAHLRLSLADLDGVITRLSEGELIDPESLVPVAWDRRQYKSDRDSTSSERSRKFREKHNEKQRLDECNGRATDVQRVANGRATREQRIPDLLKDAFKDSVEPLSLSENPDGFSSFESGSTDVAARSGDDPSAVLPEKTKACPYQAIVDLYRDILPELRDCKALTKARQGFIRQRWLDKPGPELAKWRAYFEYVRGSDFLMGRIASRDDRPPFSADLEWLCRPTNFAKVVEGKYHG